MWRTLALNGLGRVRYVPLRVKLLVGVPGHGRSSVPLRLQLAPAGSLRPLRLVANELLYPTCCKWAWDGDIACFCLTQGEIFARQPV
jgi:hypothetical protein